ncbi:MAG: uracil-DNA glycosylase [endosymbiont of Galathealinum brachiosum]|uniref:Uracil-DNA glycosylase n=1 Tax=endosymbiont of Galathealinum brachiosum TaxID=2200906 RepID=A0A370DHS9_9GAMM|nr:MAG: uracil-DNA glycosylase [endosymbiont of Galathealinum brachiosum]
MNCKNLMPALDNSWKNCLSKALDNDNSSGLNAFLQSEIDNGINILPPQELWFNALNSTPLNKVKVVILGQDPYPTPGHAHGLCFSVKPDVKPIPKSLNNIYKELKDDLGIMNENGNLQNWANQGVLLLNSVLTVQSGQANAHQGKGWEKFTDEIVSMINELDHPVAFVLWGAYAQKKGKVIDESRHLVIRSPHPSPLSSYRGFFGSKPFSQINNFLTEHGQTEIDWAV